MSNAPLNIVFTDAQVERITASLAGSLGRGNMGKGSLGGKGARTSEESRKRWMAVSPCYLCLCMGHTARDHPITSPWNEEVKSRYGEHQRWWGIISRLAADSKGLEVDPESVARDLQVNMGTFTEILGSMGDNAPRRQKLVAILHAKCGLDLWVPKGDIGKVTPATQATTPVGLCDQTVAPPLENIGDSDLPNIGRIKIRRDPELDQWRTSTNSRLDSLESQVGALDKKSSGSMALMRLMLKSQGVGDEDIDAALADAGCFSQPPRPPATVANSSSPDIVPKTPPRSHGGVGGGSELMSPSSLLSLPSNSSSAGSDPLGDEVLDGTPPTPKRKWNGDAGPSAREAEVGDLRSHALVLVTEARYPNPSLAVEQLVKCRARDVLVFWISHLAKDGVFTYVDHETAKKHSMDPVLSEETFVVVAVRGLTRGPTTDSLCMEKGRCSLPGDGVSWVVPPCNRYTTALEVPLSKIFHSAVGAAAAAPSLTSPNKKLKASTV